MQRLAVLAIAFVLAALPLAAQEPAVVISGEAVWSEPLELPAKAEVVVSLWGVAAGVVSELVANDSLPAETGQTHFPFRIEVPPARLVPESPYVLDVSIRDHDGTRWTTGPVPVELGAGPVDAGTVPLRDDRPLIPAIVWRCGDVTAQFGGLGNRLLLEIGGRSFHMVDPLGDLQRLFRGYRRHTGSAFGTRYVAADDTSTVLWTDGEETRLSLEGEELPVCRTVEVPVPARTALAGDWVVLAIGGEPVLEDAPAVTMTIDRFGTNRISGHGSCNTYTGSFASNGPLIAIGPQLAVTRTACAPAVMDQEHRFLDALGAVRRWDVGGDTATLTGGPAITARRTAQ